MKMDDRELKQRIRELEEKISKKKAEKDYFKAMQLALKLVINGTYGAFANAHFVASNADIANSITAHGRDVNQHCMNRLEKHFYEEWHLNTDMHRKLGMEYIGINADGKYQAFDIDLQPIAWGMDEMRDLLKMKDITTEHLVANEFEKDGIKILYDYKIFDFDEVKALDENPVWSELEDSDREGRMKYDGENQIIIYGDTDSLYFSYSPIMKSIGFDKMGDMKWCRRFILHMDAIYAKPLIKKILDGYADIFGVDNLHDFELETISKSALFLKKKHYLNNIIHEDGVHYDDLTYFYPKGVEIIRSSTPPFVRENIYQVINYLFGNVGNVNINNVLRIVKKVRKEFEMSDIEEISMTTSCSNYNDKVLDDTVTLETVKGAHFGVKASAFHNYLLNKNSQFKSKYDMVKSGRIKYYYCNHKTSNVFAYLRSFYPKEVVENEKVKIDMDTQFEKSFLGIVNKFIKPLGLPPINKRLSVLSSLFNF